jgi:hypothetical protein
MKKKVMVVAVVLLIAAFAFALDAGIAAMIAFHFTTRTIIEVLSNTG